MKLFDLRVEPINRKRDELKILACPVNVWTCFVPDNINPNVNILEKLILSLIQKGVVTRKIDLKNILVDQIGLDGDLIDNVFNECNIKFLNNNHNNLKLNVEAEKIMSAIDDEISPNMEMSDITKKIYLFQERATNTIVPCFNIEKLPLNSEVSIVEDDDCVVLKPQQDFQPKTAAINNALYQWGKIYKNKSMGDRDINNQIDMENEQPEIDDNMGFMEEMPTVIDEKEAQTKPKQIENITIYDDKATKFYIKGYLAFNPNDPTQIEILSPFGEDFDHWFMKIVNRKRAVDKEFELELQMFLEERADIFKDSVAFDNELNIQLFDDFPPICNNDKYKVLKKAISDLSKDVERIKNGEDESTNFAKNLRVALDTLFRAVVKANPEIYNQKCTYNGTKDTDFSKYKLEISQIVDSCRLNEEIKRKFCNKGIYKNIITSRDIDNGNTKDYAALILLYANKYPTSNAMEFVKSYQHIFLEIFSLVNLGNDAGHAGKDYLKICFSHEDILRYYAQYENMVRALYSNLIEGANNG